jgi:acyl carrier protein
MDIVQDMRKTVLDRINEVLRDTGRQPLPELDDADRLMEDIGLDSLDLAVLVVSMERAVGFDPFRGGGKTARTFGDFVSLYEHSQA